MPAVPSPRHVPGSAEWLIKIGDESSESPIPSKGWMHASGTSRNESARLAASSGQEHPANDRRRSESCVAYAEHNRRI